MRKKRRHKKRKEGKGGISRNLKEKRKTKGGKKRCRKRKGGKRK